MSLLHVLVYLRVVHNVFDVVSFGFVFFAFVCCFFVFSCSVVYLCVLSGAVSGYGFAGLQLCVGFCYSCLFLFSLPMFFCSFVVPACYSCNGLGHDAMFLNCFWC